MTQCRGAINYKDEMWRCDIDSPHEGRACHNHELKAFWQGDISNHNDIAQKTLMTMADGLDDVKMFGAAQFVREVARERPNV